MCSHPTQNGIMEIAPGLESKRLELDPWLQLVAMYMVSVKSLPFQVLASWSTKQKCEYPFRQPHRLVVTIKQIN